MQKGGAQAIETLKIGVIVQRQDLDNPWQDYSWHTIGLIPGAPDIENWRELRRGVGWLQFHAGTLTLSLYARETEGYKINLGNRIPACYVVLRRGEEAEEHDVEPFLVTLCPFEAQRYLDSGDEIVDAVPMEASMMIWLKDFCEKYHRDEPFYKRQRNKHQETKPQRFNRAYGR